MKNLERKLGDEFHKHSGPFFNYIFESWIKIGMNDKYFLELKKVKVTDFLRTIQDDLEYGFDVQYKRKDL